MKVLVWFTLTSLQLIAQVPDKAPRVVHEEMTKTEPGLRAAPEFNPRIGMPVASFEFTDLTGYRWKSEDLRGKVIYLNIWFIGCPPCVQEMPSLNALFNEYGNQKGLVMLSVALDKPEALRTFTVKNPVKLPLASLTLEQIKLLAMPSDTIGFPTHLIIDREGNLAVASRGGSDRISKELKCSLDSVLAREWPIPKS